MQKTKRVPLRKCIVCNEQKNKEELLRIVKDKENIFSIDRTGKMKGRGAYICLNDECVNKLITGRKLDKAYKMKVDDGVYDELKKQI